MFRIGKQIAFDAAHTSGCGHATEALHGHTFGVELRVRASVLRRPGFVVDFADLRPLQAYVGRTLDHRLLDDVLDDTSARGVGAHLQAWCLQNVELPAAAELDGVTVRGAAPMDDVRYKADWQTTFEAAHRLPDLPADHKCGRLHGHSYAVRAITSAGCPAWVLAPLRDHIATRFDHSYLNEVVPAPPTSEHLAHYLFDWSTRQIRWKRWSLSAVVVSETASTWAEYRP